MRIEERQAEVDSLLERHFPLTPKTAAAAQSTASDHDLTDDKLIEKAKGAKNGAKFARLFDGHWEDDYASQSEADLALCCHLAFWTRKDASRIDALFRRSGLYREKWDEKHFGSGSTYGEETVAKAVSGTREAYRAPAVEGAGEDAEQEVNERVDDPHRLARLVLDRTYDHNERPRLLFHRDEFYRWMSTRYEALPDATLRGEISGVAKTFFDEKNLEAIKVWEENGHVDPETGKPVKKPTCKTVTVSLTGNVRQALSGIVAVPIEVEQPVWLEGAPCRPPAAEIVSFTNQLIHIPTFATGATGFMFEHTPLFFSLNSMDFAFDPKAPVPVVWLEFLERLWPDDPGSIHELQKWCGYCLTADTSLQKILMLIGPPRSGKGTIARILTALLGAANVAGPTLSSFATNFGLWALLGKRLAIISDARITGRTDSAPVIERLLSISGEDTLTIDRKNLAPVSTKLDTRLMLLSNELPRLGDSSSALSSRMVVLGLSESWLGREDHGLTGRLMAELPGILLHFALPGWRMLKEDGRFIQPKSGDELVEELESLSSPIRAFINDRCVEDPAATVEVQAVFAEWRKWCDEMHREKSGDCQTFGRNLRAALPRLRVDRPRRGSDRVRVYVGLRLRLAGEEWSATVRGPFYSTRERNESSSLYMSIRSAIGGTADHRGPEVLSPAEQLCVPSGVEVGSDAISCNPGSVGRAARPFEVPESCYACGGTDFWLSRAADPICRRCHPPAPGAEEESQ
jgi:putative DNA primase/helicase